MPPIRIPIRQIKRKITELPSTGAGLVSEIDLKLNTELKEKLKEYILLKNPALDAFIDSLPIDYKKHTDESIEQIVAKLVIPAVKKNKQLQSLADKVRLSPDIPKDKSLKQLLELDTPLAEHSLFAADARRSGIEELLLISGVNNRVLERLDKLESSLENLADDEWDNLLAEKIITEKEKTELELTTNLSRLTGNNYDLVTAVRKTGIKNLEDVVKWDEADWMALMKQNNISPTDGTPGEYTSVIVKAIREYYPEKFFISRIAKPGHTAISLKSLDQLKQQLEQDPTLLEKFRSGQLPVPNDGTKEHVENVGALVNTNSHLQLAGVMSDTKLTFAEKRAVIDRRLASLQAFYDNNPAIDIGSFDFLEKEDAADPLNWANVAAEDRELVKKQLMAHQRIFNVSNGVDTAQRLLSTGFDSAIQITSHSFTNFKNKSGLSAEAATGVYNKAVDMASKASHGMATLQELTDSFKAMPDMFAFNTNLVNDLKNLDGYEQLFGAQRYCECDHCKSIFSPAAYFTDLMHFIDKDITGPAFQNASNHPLLLKTRRPDLWKLELSCSNTNDLVPHLTIVNEILESYITHTLGFSDVYNMLSTASPALTLPFNLPLESIRLYLQFFNTTLTSIYQLLDTPTDAVLKENLHLSDADFFEVTRETGHPWTPVEWANLNKLSVSAFLKYANITRRELDLLLQTSFISRKLNLEVTIEAMSNDIQDYREQLNGVSAQAYNKCGRFLRLWRKTAWTMAEMDALLIAVSGTDAVVLDDTTVLKLSHAKFLQETLDISVEDTISLIDDVPTVSVEAGKISPAYRLFVMSGILNSVTDSPDFYFAAFNAAKRDDETNDPKQGALLTVLGITEPDLQVLIRQFMQPLKLTAEGKFTLNLRSLSLLYRHALQARLLGLPVSDYTILYDHCVNGDETPGYISTVPSPKNKWKFGKAGLHIEPMSSFKKKKAGEQDDKILKQMRDIDRIASLAAELKSYGLSPMRFVDLIRGRKMYEEHLVSSVRLFDTISRIQNDDALVFNSGVLTTIKEITPEQLHFVCEQLTVAGHLVKQDESYRLASTFSSLDNITPTITTAGIAAVHAEAVMDAFMQYHPLTIFSRYLAITLGITDEEFVLLLPFIDPLKESDLFDGLIEQTEEAAASSPVFAALLKYFQKTELLHDYFTKLGLQGSDLAFIKSNSGVFGIEEKNSLIETDLLRIASYSRLLKLDGENKTKIRALLKSFNWTAKKTPGPEKQQPFDKLPSLKKAKKKFETTPLELGIKKLPGTTKIAGDLTISEVNLWAQISKRDIGVMLTVFESKFLSENAIDAFGTSLQLHDLCATFGINALKLPAFAKRDFKGYTDIVQLLRTAIRNNTADLDAFKEALKTPSQQLNMLKRDALCNFIISKEKLLHFEDRKDLYDYFLIDPEMSGCFDTSRVVAALSSLQLYVYRCLLNLEQSASTGLNVASSINTGELSQEWEWMKNYRVWEANRKVFLYPENYLQPELRDDKTPQFKQLEEELLGRPVNLVAAEMAYKKYLDGFSEVSRLTIAGSYFHPGSGSRKSQYIFLGRTSEDPYQYYFRKYYPSNEEWTHWEKIDTGISSAYASPIMYAGKLFIFWNTVNTRERSKFASGNSIFLGHEYSMEVSYTYLSVDGRWAPAQKIKYPVKDFVTRHIEKFTIPLPFNVEFNILFIKKPLSTDWRDYFLSFKTTQKIYPYVHNESVFLNFLRRYHASKVVVGGSEMTSEEIEKLAVETNDVSSEVRYVHDEYKRKLDFIANKVDDEVAPDNHFSKKTSRMVNTMQDTEEQMRYVLLSLKDSKYRLSTHKLNCRKSNFSSIDSALLWFANNDFTPGSEDNLTHLSGELPEDLRPELHVVLNRFGDNVIKINNDSFLIRNMEDSSFNMAKRILVRLNATLGAYLERRLFEKGIDRFLSPETQQKSEAPFPIQITKPEELKPPLIQVNKLPFRGPYGTYYRELFFHIPMLIANHLNATFKFKDAKYWQEKVFNPTATGNNNSSLKSRVWNFIEFRSVDVPKLRDILTATDELALYHKDPFNPHAIARLRMSAYQKSTVMKYIDNLIDWADSLFTRDTMETVNEAMMLYSVALDILGKRPIKTGKCKTATSASLTYEALGPAIDRGSEFLMMVENKIGGMGNMKMIDEFEAFDTGMASSGAVTDGTGTGATPIGGTGPRENAASNNNGGAIPLTGNNKRNAGLRSRSMKMKRKASYTATINEKKDRLAGMDSTDPDTGVASSRNPGQRAMKQMALAFCVPYNEVLMGYWDRLDDRLFKIRHCLNINGEYRQMALFDPPIDPMLLTRAKAAGISIDEIISSIYDAPPPYRFNYLLAKAKAASAGVQSFGNSLLSALEKKDVEELNGLKTVHEKNILEKIAESKRGQLKEAEKQLQSLTHAKTAVEKQVTYYSNLIANGLNPAEQLQQATGAIAGVLSRMAGKAKTAASFTFLIPNAGSPFAMTYGGREIGSFFNAIGDAISSDAAEFHTVSAIAGAQAGFQRRGEEWAFAHSQAQQELKQLDKQVLAAEIRVAIAENDLQTHQLQTEQSAELYDFIQTKLTGIGLYNYHAATLSKLHRDSYTLAFQLAKMTEKAFQFELNDDTSSIKNDNWQFDQNGLLAGDQLQLQLQQLENSYLEKNKRKKEITQSFSMAMIDPLSLLELRESGKCALFEIPELAFDLLYPGQYRRIIKSVQVSIPCIAGPYTNIGVKLTLTNSRIRRDATLGEDNEKFNFPSSLNNTSIATSSAQNDSGMFILNFQDDRLLPFEGAGAVSSWKLELPSILRSFDYNTISDIIFQVSYVAEEDGLHREQVETEISGRFMQYAQTKGLYRLFSLRQDFPETHYRLLNGDTEAALSEFTIVKNHFPFLLTGKRLKVKETTVFLKPVKDKTIETAGLSVQLNGSGFNTWSDFPSGLPDTSAVWKKSSAPMMIDPVIKWTIQAAGEGFNKNTIEDVLVLLQYTVE
jgi:hypothetical protein